ncbi:MAG: major facilitator superfamily transporter [Candidatus Aramenus sulfurataquae]|uniref:Major facilitator superfamily transporter n=1 Tax=Candidatus Aramenus sulfurataquae TaxID=1326980 RepID=W7KKK3_9CREN|nr:MAG: major facilitator superfamily transporter [Candidatus Aramenus sulfurataquae]
MKYSFALGWLLTFLQLALRLGWGVVAVVFAVSLHLTPVEIGAVLFLFYLGYTSSSVLWGAMIDKEGPRKAMFISATFSGLLLPLVFLAKNVDELYAIYLLEGVLTAGIYPSAVKVVSASGGSLTLYLALLDSAAPVVTLVISSLSGEILSSWTFYYVTLSLGLFLGGLLSLSLKVSTLKSTQLRKVLLDRRVIYVSLIRAGEQWGLWGTSSWLFPFLVLYDGVPVKLSEILFLLYGVGQFTSTLVSGLLSRTVDDVKLVKVTLAAFVALVFALPLAKEASFLIPLSFLLGVFSFIYRPPTDSLVVKVMGSRHAGTSMGFANAISQAGSMVAPLFVGEVISLGLKGFAIDSLAFGPLASLALVTLVVKGNSGGSEK